MCVGKMQQVPVPVPVESRSLVESSEVPRKVATRKFKFDSSEDNSQIQYQEDVLAISTYYTKVVLFTISDLTKKFQDSHIYKILCHTTQPAHLVTILSVIYVSFLMIPSENQSRFQSPLWGVLYLGSFSAHLGAQIWMTFISGLSLYFALPRHTFGNIQQVLFPKYFLLNAVLSLITLIVFLKSNNSKLETPEVALQAAGMTICFLAELIIRLYLTSPLLRLMTVKNQIEKEAGVGMEIGKLMAGELLNCPHYLKIHKAFRKVHMTIAIGNLVAMACTVFHLYYLSHKLLGVL